MNREELSDFIGIILYLFQYRARFQSKGSTLFNKGVPVCGRIT